MIVREILKNPELANKFDYFNDTKDTMAFLHHQPQSPERDKALLKLWLAHEVWLKKHHAEFAEKRAAKEVAKEKVPTRNPKSTLTAEETRMYHAGYIRAMFEVQELLADTDQEDYYIP